MYSVRPLGLNIKDNDRDVLDGSLQESINMQWRDGSFKPIPERLVSEINAAGYKNVILHKIGDENSINVLGFNESASSNFLAFDLAGYLGGEASGGNVLEWIGTITNGVYSTRPTLQLPFVRTLGMSFTILNGIMYFMGDGSNPSEQYYIRVEFDEATQSYKTFDMYAWKSLIPFYPYQLPVKISAPKNTYQAFTQCGLVLIRFALVLKTGEVVLHSPIYGSLMFGINRSTTAIKKGDLIQNIHSLINLNLDFADMTLFNNEISAINVYASTPYYETKFTQDLTGNFKANEVFKASDVKGKFKIKAEEPFYLIKTIEAPVANDKILLTVGSFDSDITLPAITPFLETIYSKIDANTIAAGEIMPVDNFSYHKLYGKITSYNGRLVVKRPITLLSGGHMRALATLSGISNTAFSITTEDGQLDGVSYEIDKSVFFSVNDTTQVRGLLSYPDSRASLVGANYPLSSNNIRQFKCRKNNLHNLSCAFDIYDASAGVFSIRQKTSDKTRLETSASYSLFIIYNNHVSTVVPSSSDANVKYSSENRIQFSQAGEFKVWPAINSYRVGEGKVMSLGIGSVNPSESQVISPIIIGTTDGTYTVNLDPMGNNFIASITRSKNIPFVSEEVLEIDNDILFVSDQGLMVYSNGDYQNLTIDYFPQQGDGDYPTQDNVLPGYDLLTSDFFGVNGNPYVLDDIVNYMKGAVLAYDSRRRNIWCSNPNYNFSMVFNLDMKQWGMSTMVFDEKQEVFSTLNTAQGQIYSRYMVKKVGTNNLLILSGEDLNQEVFYHVLTRPMKFQNTDDYKVLPRMISRTLLLRSSSDGYVSIGLWGVQEVNKYKKSIPIAIKKDDRNDVYPNNQRYHLPVDCRKGKYKTIVLLQAGKALPESYISSFDFDIYLVDNNKIR